MNRKSFICVFAILFIAMGSANLFPNGGFSVSIMGNYFKPADGGFKNFYGENHYYPEFRLNLKLFNGLYLWSSYGFLSAEGTTIPQLNEKTGWKQSFLSFGGGYKAALSGRLSSFFRLGGLYTKYKEEALETTIDDSAFGFVVSASLIFDITGTFFTKLELGYLSVSDTIDNASIKLGGFKGGIGIGIKF
jgi:hypothetical protein